MIEREMEDLLWDYPEKFLYEPLKQFERQPAGSVGRADLSFIDSVGRILVIEVKHGDLPRGAIAQLQDYFGMFKKRFPNKPVELMVIANRIQKERRLACEQADIDAREIPEKKFRDVAKEVGYIFSSEIPVVPPVPPEIGATASEEPRRVGTGTRRGDPLSKEEFLNDFDSVSDHSQEAIAAKRILKSLAECNELAFKCHRTKGGDSCCTIVRQQGSQPLLNAAATHGRTKCQVNLGKKKNLWPILMELSGYELPVEGNINVWCAENESNATTFIKWIMDAANKG